MGEVGPYLTSLAVPLLLLFVGTLAKKLVRKTGGWQVTDLFLGVEASAAALTGGLTYILDVVKLLIDKVGADAKGDVTGPVLRNLLAAGVFLALACVLFFFLLSTHQDWEQFAEPEQQEPWWRKWSWHRKRFWLAGVSNLIGFGLLVSFLLIIKKFA